MNKRICHILFNDSADPIRAYKDFCMILYHLAKDYGWISTYACFSEKNIVREWSPKFTKFVDVDFLGVEHDVQKQINLAKKYFKKNIESFDVIMFATYGSIPWKLAKYCKKLKPSIKIYCKLDMNAGGFSHFNTGRRCFWIRDIWEWYRSRYVDFFTVETKTYYDNIKESKTFKKKIEYIPNGVSLLDVNDAEVDFKKKENIVVTLGRLGTLEKNTELFLNSLMNISEDIRNQWKYYFVGPQTEEFSVYMNDFLNHNPAIAENIVQLGNITDRNELANLLKKAKIICMPSRTESTCIATLEGMFFGCIPVISRYSEFVKDTTNNEMIGKIVDDYTSLGLAKALEEYMADEEKIRIEMEQSMIYARKRFSYDYIVSDLNNFLKRVLKE